MAATNVIAVLALLISVATGTVQVLTWWRDRYRVTADCRIKSVTAKSGDEVRNFSYVTVTLRHVGRANAVDDISFQWRSGKGTPPGGLGWRTANVSPEFLGRNILLKDIEVPELMGIRRTVADGEIVSWTFVIHSASREFTSKPQSFRARIRLASGKVVRTNKFSYQPVYKGPD